MRKTKTTICLILLAAVIISVISPVFLGVNKSYAAPGDIPNSQEIKGPCRWYSLLDKDCALFTAANIVYYIIFRTTNFITMAGGVIFDASVAFSLSGEAFDAKNNAMLEVGWKATRDFANLFFIFIILYIAIATILQLSGYGSKSLLIKVIIVALLINFSLMITKVVIDASHVLAWEFYNKIGDTGENQFVADEPAIEINLKSLDKIAPQKRNLSAVFLAGFDPQNMTIGGKGYDEMLKMASKDGFFSILWQIIVIYVLASILNLVMAFILFAGAVLFIIRIIVLWLVMILSPLAFIGMILPGKMAGLAKEWWGHLFNQSFFAPAFLFLFYLVATLIDSKFIQNVIKASNNAPTVKVVGIDFGSTIIVIFHFIIIGGLMIGCLIIAKKMGAVGANTMMSWGKKLQDAAQGYVGRGAKYAGMAPLRGARAGVGYGADVAAGGIDTGKGKWAQTLRALPGLGKWAASRSEKVRKDIEERKKEHGKYSEQELKEKMAAPEGAWGPVKKTADLMKGIGGFVRRADRAAIVGALAEKKSLKGVAEKTIARAEKTISRYGAKTKDIKNLQWQYAPEIDPSNPTIGVKERTEAIEGYFNPITNKWDKPRLNPEAIEDIDIEKYFDKPAGAAGYNPRTHIANADVREAMYKTFHGGHIKNFIKRGDSKEISDRFFKNMEDDYARTTGATTKQISDLIDWLEIKGNRQLSAWVRSNSGRQLLQSYKWS